MFDVNANATQRPVSVPKSVNRNHAWQFEPCGECCVILVFDTVFSIERNRQAASAANALRHLKRQGLLPGITDVVAAMVTVGVHYSSPTSASPDLSRHRTFSCNGGLSHRRVHEKDSSQAGC